MGDGSVRFIAQKINVKTFAALVIAQAGEVFNLP